MSDTIDIRDEKITREKDYSNIKKIIFSESDGGFDASYITRTEEAIEMDSGYINPSDLENFNKALKLALFLKWNERE